jgi:hypothetical protein
LFLLRRRADVAAVDSLHEFTREAGFARVVFAVYGAKVEELIDEGILLFILSQDGLKRGGKLS